MTQLLMFSMSAYYDIRVLMSLHSILPSFTMNKRGAKNGAIQLTRREKEIAIIEKTHLKGKILR